MKLEEILATPGWDKSEDFEDLSEGSERPWYVYRHTCTVNGKCYIGISCHPVRRWKQHVFSSKSDSCACRDTKFKRALRKYQAHSWRHEILAVAKDMEQANALEVELICSYKCFVYGYNSTIGGDGNGSGYLLCEEFIVERVREHFSASWSYPHVLSGAVDGGYTGDTWSGYNMALISGNRGLSGGSSLAKLMSRLVTGYDNPANRPELTTDFIVDRAKEHFLRYRKFPTAHSGAVNGGHPGDTWLAYNCALMNGTRSLCGGTSLSQLLSASGIGHTNKKGKPRLTEEFILSRITEHFQRTHRFPVATSGAVMGGHAGDTWLGYERALINGNRGLPGGSSLSRLMKRSNTGYSSRLEKPTLTTEAILERCVEYFVNCKKYPTRKSGAVQGGYKGDTWMAYDQALTKGARGLPGGSSLAKLLDTIRKPKPSQT